MNTPADNALAALRNGHPDVMVPLFMEGQCVTLSLMLRALFPQARAWYAAVEGHVYTEIDGASYDIRGRHNRLPDHSAPLDWQQTQAHRWPGRDQRVLCSPHKVLTNK